MATDPLETYEEEFPAKAAETATVVLLNLLFELPEQPRGFFEFDSETTVKRVVLRLLRPLPTPKAIEEAVRSALPAISTRSGRITLLNLVGHEENIGHELIS